MTRLNRYRDLHFQIQVDAKEVERLLSGMPREAPRAIASALNKTMRNVRTAAKRQISKESGLQPSFIGDRMKTNLARPSSLVADLTVKTKGVLVSELKGAEQTARGIRYNGPNGRKITIEHGFMHGTGEERKSYIRRHADSVGQKAQGRFGLVGRMPIRYLWAPNLVDIFKSDRLFRVMLDRAEEQWPKNIGHEISYRINKGVGRNSAFGWRS